MDGKKKYMNFINLSLDRSQRFSIRFSY